MIETIAIEEKTRTSAISSLVVQLTSHAEHSNETWPFVTLPDFEMKASLVLDLAEVLSIIVLPLVVTENLEQWGNYSVANQGWYAEGVAIQEKQQNAGETFGHEYNVSATSVRPMILTTTGSGFRPANLSDKGPFYPCWQYSPPIPMAFVNIDFGGTDVSAKDLSYYTQLGGRENIVGKI